MFTKTKLALVAALLLGASSSAFAQTHHAVRHHHVTTQSFQSRDVSMPTPPVSAAQEEWMDRASQNFDGGGY